MVHDSPPPSGPYARTIALFNGFVDACLASVAVTLAVFRGSAGLVILGVALLALAFTNAWAYRRGRAA